MNEIQLKVEKIFFPEIGMKDAILFIDEKTGKEYQFNYSALFRYAKVKPPYTYKIWFDEDGYPNKLETGVYIYTIRFSNSVWRFDKDSNIECLCQLPVTMHTTNKQAFDFCIYTRSGELIRIIRAEYTKLTEGCRKFRNAWKTQRDLIPYLDNIEVIVMNDVNKPVKAFLM